MSDTVIDSTPTISQKIKFPRTRMHQQRREVALTRFKFNPARADDKQYMAVKNLELQTLKSRLNKGA